MGRQILTNKYNLPETIVNACRLDTHRVSGDISVTQLIDSPQVRILKRKFDYETDVTEMLYALMGTALHNILERANISEVRKRAFLLTAETIVSKAEEIASQYPDKSRQLLKAAEYINNLIPVFFGEKENKYVFEKTLRLDFGNMTLYGTFDLYDKETGILWDYKFCSVFNWVYPEARKKWMRQTNVYAYMLEANGYKVNGIKIVAFFRDYNNFAGLRNPDYPDSQIKEIDIVLKPMDEIKEFIEKRIKAHQDAETGETILQCTGEDRWATADEYAVMTPKSKKAIRKFPTKGLAIGFMEENRHLYDNMYIDPRLGESKRCEKYCPVSKHCAQYQEEKNLKKIKNG